MRDKVLGIDKSLREIYSVVIARVEEKRRGQAKEQMLSKEAAAKARASENEKVQRQQWTQRGKNEEFLGSVPVPIKAKIVKTADIEEQERKKFMQDVEQATQVKGQQQQKSNIK